MLTVCSFSTSLQAHEYWLEPVTSVVKMDNKALINIKNGENFSGPSYPYNPERVKSISITNKRNTQPYSGRLGDYPAIQPKLTSSGIYSIAIETNPQNLTYSSWQKFTTFLDYHGFTDVLDRHLERKLPKVDVTEIYTRSAKTLVQVKAGRLKALLANTMASSRAQKTFAPVGHAFEMVLLATPFGETTTVRVKLLFNDKPLGNRQAEMFWKGDRRSRLTTMTNADGIATFDLLGEGDYLLSSVHLTEPKNKEAHWASHWASITFRR